jgi:hypothetical protein
MAICQDDEREEPPMDSATGRDGRTDRRFRLATNDNETIVEDPATDDQDVEGHRLATNDSEIVVDGMRRFAGDDDDESEDPLDVAGPSRDRAR